MTCVTCLVDKPPECFLSLTTRTGYLGSRCVACTGHVAGVLIERRRQYSRIEAHKAREASKSALERYWEKNAPQYIPEKWVKEWIKDMRAMVPKLIESL